MKAWSASEKSGHTIPFSGSVLLIPPVSCSKVMEWKDSSSHSAYAKRLYLLVTNPRKASVESSSRVKFTRATAGPSAGCRFQIVERTESEIAGKPGLPAQFPSGPCFLTFGSLSSERVTS